MSIPLSSGSPTLSFFIRSRSFSRSRLATLSWTSIRDPAQQTCPWLNQIASTIPSTVLSKSASSKTRKGDLPPSSKVSFLSLEAVFSRIWRPTSVEPVNAIFETPGWAANIAPVVPEPVSRLKTPGGRPIRWHISANQIAVNGVNSAGFKTTVFPAARAGATFQANISRGKFQGMIWPTTPNGWWFLNSWSRSWAQPAWW